MMLADITIPIGWPGLDSGTVTSLIIAVAVSYGMVAIYKKTHTKNPDGTTPGIMASLLWGVGWTTQILDTWKKVDTNPADVAKIDRFEAMMQRAQDLLNQLSSLVPNNPPVVVPVVVPAVIPQPAPTPVVIPQPPAPAPAATTVVIEEKK
jgi:hypothetical protein